MKKLFGALLIVGVIGVVGAYSFISAHKVNDHYIEFSDGSGYYHDKPIFKIF